MFTSYSEFPVNAHYYDANFHQSWPSYSVRPHRTRSAPWWHHWSRSAPPTTGSMHAWLGLSGGCPISGPWLQTTSAGWACRGCRWCSFSSCGRGWTHSTGWRTSCRCHSHRWSLRSAVSPAPSPPPPPHPRYHSPHPLGLFVWRCWSSGSTPAIFLPLFFRFWPLCWSECVCIWIIVCSSSRRGCCRRMHSSCLSCCQSRSWNCWYWPSPCPEWTHWLSYPHCPSPSPSAWSAPCREWEDTSS